MDFLVLFRFFKETPELLFNQRVLTRDDLQSLTVFGVMALGAWSLFKRSPMGLGLTAAGIGGSVQASDRLSEICGAYENRSNVIQLVREASIEQQMQAVHDCPLLATSLYGWYLDAQPID